MSLKHTLLGFLNYYPMTGYELKKTFDDSVQHFWGAELSQIYPTLNKMRTEGLLTMEVKIQENAPAAKVYSITEAGRAELLRWLKEPVALTQHREAFLIKVFFGSQLTQEEMLAQFEDQLQKHLERSVFYQKMLTDGCEEYDNPEFAGEIRFWDFTVHAGLGYEEAMIAWCRETIDVLKCEIEKRNIEKGSGGKP